MKLSESIRLAIPDDAAQLAPLSDQLGYPCDEGVIRDRLCERFGDSGCAVFVSLREGVVVGWLEVGIRGTLESGSWGEILGLVVDKTVRRAGIGRALVDAARAWTAERGLARLRVRTNVRRDDAAAFYGRYGFRETKQQRVFELDINPHKDHPTDEARL